MYRIPTHAFFTCANYLNDLIVLVWWSCFLIVSFRNPDHQKRPSFEEACVYLQQPAGKLLYWNHTDDLIAENVKSLGAELDIANELFLDLQVTYKEDNDYEDAP